jgi:DNA helicase-2/ATP-dependent DNA helicase PcrA
MAARRMGFAGLFNSLYSIDEFSTGLLDGTLPAARIFARDILGVVAAQKSGDKFSTARIVRESSPLLSAKALKESKDPSANIKSAKKAVETLMTLWKNGVPTCGAVLSTVADANLFDIPESLKPVLELRKKEAHAVKPEDGNAADEVQERIKALVAFLDTSFDEVAPYAQYVSRNAPFDTHQGVKGREFERVMVLIDDAEARGFLFGYEKLLGAKDLSPGDLKNMKEGKETSIDRTRRLFYVTCSRARKSLALVIYSEAPGRREISSGKQWRSERNWNRTFSR